MNRFIETQVLTMNTYAKSFLQGCKMAARTNDGVVDKKERERLDRIEKATKDYILQLNKIIKR